MHFLQRVWNAALGVVIWPYNSLYRLVQLKQVSNWTGPAFLNIIHKWINKWINFGLFQTLREPWQHVRGSRWWTSISPRVGRNTLNLMMCGPLNWLKMLTLFLLILLIKQFFYQGKLNSDWFESGFSQEISLIFQARQLKDDMSKKGGRGSWDSCLIQEPAK